MSTRNIEAVLQWVGRGDGPPELADALAELAAIREAAHEVVAQKALEDWQSCMPSELASSIRLLQRIAKEGA